MAGMTQEVPANHIDMSHQQVQKYERGTGRVSSSMLYEMSRILERDIAEFFEGLDADPVASGPGSSVNSGPEMMMHIRSKDGLRLYRAFARIQDNALRSKVIALLEGMVGIEEGE